MIRKFWRKYIYTIITYSDSRDELKHLIANLMAITLFLPFNYILFIFIFNSKEYLFILLISIGKGRLFLAYLMEKYKRNFGNGYTPFWRYISYSMLILVTFILIFVLIRDIKNNTNIQELIEKEYKHLKVENNNSNIQINENSNNSKYDYLLQNNK